MDLYCVRFVRSGKCTTFMHIVNTFVDVQKALLSPVAGPYNISGVHSVQSLLDKFRLPLTVRLVCGVIPTKVHITVGQPIRSWLIMFYCWYVTNAVTLILTVWPWTCIGCQVLKLHTKFKRNHTICGWHSNLNNWKLWRGATSWIQERREPWCTSVPNFNTLDQCEAELLMIQPIFTARFSAATLYRLFLRVAAATSLKVMDEIHGASTARCLRFHFESTAP